MPHESILSHGRFTSFQWYLHTQKSCHWLLCHLPHRHFIEIYDFPLSPKSLPPAPAEQGSIWETFSQYHCNYSLLLLTLLLYIVSQTNNVYPFFSSWASWWAQNVKAEGLSVTQLMGVLEVIRRMEWMALPLLESKTSLKTSYFYTIKETQLVTGEK